MSLFFVDDEQIISRIAEGCREKRLLINMTQEVLAQKANVSLATVKKFEGGAAISMRTAIAVLRALGEIERLQFLIPEVQESPSEIYDNESSTSSRVRLRASGGKS